MQPIFLHIYLTIEFLKTNLNSCREFRKYYFSIVIDILRLFFYILFECYIFVLNLYGIYFIEVVLECNIMVTLNLYIYNQ